MSLHPFWFCWNCRASNEPKSSRCAHCYTSRSAATAPAQVAHTLLHGSLLLVAFLVGYVVMFQATLSVLLLVQ